MAARTSLQGTIRPSTTRSTAALWVKSLLNAVLFFIIFMVALLRNPIMAGELLVIWGGALYLASWGALLYALTISIAAHLMVVHVEEPELRKRFGESYAEYCRDVPRWLPRLRPQE